MTTTLTSTDYFDRFPAQYSEYSSVWALRLLLLAQHNILLHLVPHEHQRGYYFWHNTISFWQLVPHEHQRGYYFLAQYHIHFAPAGLQVPNEHQRGSYFWHNTISLPPGVWCVPPEYQQVLPFFRHA